MVQKKAQFDDRIRNLLALAEDNSVESRTLLFSHICDLFLQERPMESDNQIRMLIEIINELIGDVDITIRKELANILLTINSPPEELIKLISEDVVEVSNKLLEEATIEDEQILYLIKYASNDHRDHIGRRFGLSPLHRRELDKAKKQSEQIKLEVTELLSQVENKKISLQDLEEAEQNSTELNEDATANILEILRAKKNIEADISVVTSAEQDLIEPSINTNDLIEEETLTTEFVSLTSKIRQHDKELAEETLEGITEAEIDYEEEIPSEKPIEEEELILDHIAPQSGPTSVIDEWFWEIDRYGNIKYLSENAESVFLQTSATVIGEDFLCLWRRKGADENDPNDFIALFEKRQAFRDEEFLFEISPNVFQGYLLSAIATFDLDNGRFTGFRGSVHSDMNEIESLIPEETHDNDNIADIETPDIDVELVLTTPQEHIQIEEPKNHLPQFSGNLMDELTGIQDNYKSDDGAPSQQHSSPNERQDEVASEMLHNLSHEFRTPLNAIIGFSQMIDNEMWGPVSDQYRKNTKDIISAANHLKEAVNNILDSAKLEAGLIEPSPESFSLKAIIQDAMIAIAPIIESREIQVSGIDDNIDVILYNDKHCVILCLIKIITFATRHANIGDNFHLSVLVNSKAQVRIEIPLINQNINEQNADDLFQKTHNLQNRNDDSKSDNTEFGTKIAAGFGLSVAQDIAKMIGGKISTMAENGKVTHVVLTISTYPI
ncbi:MAG: hypothetical protein JKY84_03330 [Emcibacteraceae bacterium]|nr:hypothetical protein [Emcibacteraceae bacterium]